MDTKEIQKATETLKSMFEYFNRKYFDSKLTEPVITIQSDPKRKAYGWFTTYKAWHDDMTKGSNYEINVTAETLNRPIKEVGATLLHEMIHLHCQENNIKDTSRGGSYHNSKFKEEATKHGLIVSYDSKIGWSTSELADEKDVEHFERITIRRIIPDKANKAKKPSYKHTCPCCGNIARTTKYIRLICADCYETNGEADIMEIEEC